METSTPDITTLTQSPTEPASSWLHTNLRALILVILAGAVAYLAVLGIAEARGALIQTFTVLVFALWGERAALKIPGKDS